MRHWHRRLDMLTDKDKDGENADQGEVHSSLLRTARCVSFAAVRVQPGVLVLVCCVHLFFCNTCCAYIEVYYSPHLTSIILQLVQDLFAARIGRVETQARILLYNSRDLTPDVIINIIFMIVVVDETTHLTREATMSIFFTVSWVCGE